MADFGKFLTQTILIFPEYFIMDLYFLLKRDILSENLIFSG